jgi:uncharacterized protein
MCHRIYRRLHSLHTVCWLALGLLVAGCAPSRTDLMTSEELFHNPKVLSMAKAAESGDVASIERLLNEGVDVNSLGRGNATVLSRALRAKSKPAYQFLLEHGANPNVLDSHGIGVINLAALEPDPYWLEQALRNGGNANAVSIGNPLGEVTPLFFAIDKSRINNVRILIEHGADLDFQDSVGNTPVYYAAERQRYDIVLILLEAGADVRLKNKFGHGVVDLTLNIGESYVHESQRPFFLQVNRFLIERGAN